MLNTKSEMEKKNKITTGKQFETLIDELEKKPSLARGVHRGFNRTNTFRKDWENITLKLNAQGPPTRRCDGWLRVWKDYKFKLRRKILQVEAEKNGTANENYKSVFLFPLEKKAAKVISFQVPSNTENSVSDYHPVVENQTLWEQNEVFESTNQSTTEEIKKEDDSPIREKTVVVDEENFPTTSANSFQVQMLPSPDRRKTKRKCKSEQRQELLENHTAMQEDIFSEISNHLMELKNILKESTHYQQKMLEVEEQKVEIMQRRNEREEQLFKSEMKLKLMELKIKTKELEEIEKQIKS